MVSSIALEIAAFVSALPMRKYRAKYHKSLNESEDNKDKLAKTRNRTIALGTTAVALAIVGVKLNHQKNTEEAVDSGEDIKQVADNIIIDKCVADTKEEIKEERIKEEPKEKSEEILKKETEEKNDNISKKETNKWKCVECDHENDGEKKVCSYCGTLRSDILSQALREW